MSETPTSPALPFSLSRAGRITLLVVAFLGWMFGGMNMTITQMIGQAATIDFLRQSGEMDPARYKKLIAQAKADEKSLAPADRVQLKVWNELVAQGFAWYNCSFLFGAASGGLLFGWVGDRFGRAKGMTASIFTYSVLPFAAYFAETPTQFLILWYLTSLGIGGMWPNGVALVSEAWAGMSRPAVAGLMGASANIGIFALSTVAAKVAVTPDSWRWLVLVGTIPVVLAVVSLLLVPESPRWLTARSEHSAERPTKAPIGEIFRPPLLAVTLVGIVLATTPLFGGWGSSNWMIPWAGAAGESANPPNPFLKAHVQQVRAMTGIVGSLLGGWIASVVGRRRSYFLVSFFALLTAQYIFWFLTPTDPAFLYWVGALGFFSGVFFGWMPLFLPELFPTRVRSTGAGVSFNFGRIATAVTLFATGMMMEAFAGDYAQIGRVTSLVYAVGMIAICFAPDTSKKEMRD